jgi:hypothetical protein
MTITVEESLCFEENIEPLGSFVEGEFALVRLTVLGIQYKYVQR